MFINAYPNKLLLNYGFTEQWRDLAPAPCPLSCYVWGCIQCSVPRAARLGNAHPPDQGWRCCVSGTSVGGGFGVVDVCDRYGEGILPPGKEGYFERKVVFQTNGTSSPVDTHECTVNSLGCHGPIFLQGVRISDKASISMI